MDQCFPDELQLTDGRSLHTKGKAMLLVGRFMEETANFESNAIMKAYRVMMPSMDSLLISRRNLQETTVSPLFTAFH